MVKLICLDLDGTTLNKNHKISEVNMQFIRKAQESGIRVIVTTGRSFETSYQFASQISNDKNDYLVCYNGASVREIKTGKQIFKKTLTGNSVEKILNLINAQKIDGLAYSVTPYRAHIYKKTLLNRQVMKRALLKPLEGNPKESYKVLVFSPFESKVNRVKETLFKELSRFEIAKAGKRGLEINSKGVSKWLGVQQLMEKWDIKPDEVAAIGDSMNDFKLMKNVKYSYAVKNAFPELKAISYKVLSEDNNENAVAAGIYHILNDINNVEVEWSKLS